MIPGPAYSPRDFTFAALDDPAALSRLPDLDGSLDSLGAAGAALLMRPDLASEDTVRSLAGIVLNSPIAAVRRFAATLMLSLAGGPLGKSIVCEVELLLLVPARMPGSQDLFRVYLMLCAGWIDRISPSALTRIAARRKHWRRRLAWYGLARLAAARGEAVGLPRHAPVFAALVRDVLNRPAPRILFTHAEEAGVGDEMSHASILLDPWLEASSTLTIDVVSGRRFLYTHPRVRAVAAAEASPEYDLVIHYGTPLSAARGRSEIHLSNRFNVVSVRHCNRSLPLPSRVRFRSHNGYYGLGWQLTAALGFRISGGWGYRECVLASDGNDVREEWDALRAGAEKTCLFHPFGGTYPRKGVYESEYPAAREWIEQLVAKGYRVIVIPNRQPWGTHAAIDRLLGPLPPEVRAHVAVPGGEVNGRSMIRFRHFVSRADRIVAVEGWLIHAAYALGRPYDVIMIEPWHLSGAGSALLHWIPIFRRDDQRIAPPVSATTPSFHQAIWPRHLLRADLIALMAKWGDRRGAEWALAQLSGVRTTRAAQLLRLIRRCLTPDLRTKAEAAALRWIDHPKPRLRAEAARLLLATGSDLSHRFGSDYRVTLDVFAWIGIAPLHSPELRQRIASHGEAARPALTIALDDEEDALYRERIQEILSAMA